MEGIRGTSPSKNSPSTDSPEQLLDAFKSAALSVTKLYKTAAAAQTKARSDGYQECLDDLLAFLDKQRVGISDGEGWQIRRWATERLDGRDAISQAVESEDEVEKTETASSPEVYKSGNPTQPMAMRGEPSMQTDLPAPIAIHESIVAPPTQENFTFQSTISYPQESDLNMANLDLSDSRSNNHTTAHHTPTPGSRPRLNRMGQRPRTSTQLNRVAGTKRKINFAEIFDLGSIGGKDMFGNGAKRSRHT